MNKSRVRVSEDEMLRLNYYKLMIMNTQTGAVGRLLDEAGVPPAEELKGMMG
ncbi:hypothetical protein [Salinigranum halophilum]|uniref:hypothetical protein n=1 Tax=Salinigranum halophilum TaxID=2565931 RepID=UPI0013760205|nr:hypothetical protein [Salinigranum halophilum]